ncbi:MAG: hypothetical protein RDU20_19020 [Desulfomonilaceae bacterium]|nr:hypothetical protein [Desulfomonilaceae bacterium]
MGFVRCSGNCSRILVFLLVVCNSHPGFAWDNAARSGSIVPQYCVVGLPHVSPVVTDRFNLTAPAPLFPPYRDYHVKLAYGSTFGTSTQLDYATLELSKSLTRYPALTIFGPAVAEVQVAVLASYVLYHEGTIEKLKRLDFQDGYEIAWLPKGKFTFPTGVFGISPYLESGAGLGYVSETYRNSGSRWNWSFVNGCGLEKCLPGQGKVSLGVQWRHMCNGNMWGRGDELHNSNSGTDMIQGLASFLQPF